MLIKRLAVLLVGRLVGEECEEWRWKSCVEFKGTSSSIGCPIPTPMSPRTFLSVSFTIPSIPAWNHLGHDYLLIYDHYDPGHVGIRIRPSQFHVPVVGHPFPLDIRASQSLFLLSFRLLFNSILAVTSGNGNQRFDPLSN